MVLACDACVGAGLPSIKRKLSLTHINKKINIEITADFLVTRIHEEKFKLLNIVGKSTKYGKLCLVAERTSNAMMRSLETEVILDHGAAKTFGNDTNCNRGVMEKYLG